MVNSSRREKVKQQREMRQATLLIFLTIAVILSVLFWGIPLLGKLAGMMIRTEPGDTASRTEKPQSPHLLDIPEATSSARISIDGYAGAGSEVILYLNNTPTNDLIADDTGSFSFSNIALDEGDNLIYAVAKNNQVESEPSPTYTVIHDNKAPELTITSPANGSTITGDKNRVVAVTGSVNEPSSQVYVGERRAIVDSTGAFSVNHSLSEGEQKLTVKAIDEAGNETSQELSLRFER